MTTMISRERGRLADQLVLLLKCGGAVEARISDDSGDVAEAETRLPEEVRLPEPIASSWL